MYPQNPAYKSTVTQLPDAYGAINVNLTFPAAVLNHSIHIIRKIPDLMNMGEGLEKYATISAIHQVRGLDFLIRAGIYPQFREEYVEKADVFVDALKDMSVTGGKKNRIETVFPKVYDYLYYIGNNFGHAGVLPPIEEITDLSTLKSQKMRQDEKTLKLAINLLRKHGPQLLQRIRTRQVVRQSVKDEKSRFSRII